MRSEPHHLRGLRGRKLPDPMVTEQPVQWVVPAGSID